MPSCCIHSLFDDRAKMRDGDWIMTDVRGGEGEWNEDTPYQDGVKFEIKDEKMYDFFHGMAVLNEDDTMRDGFLSMMRAATDQLGTKQVMMEFPPVRMDTLRDTPFEFHVYDGRQAQAPHHEVPSDKCDAAQFLKRKESDPPGFSPLDGKGKFNLWSQMRWYFCLIW